MTSSASEILNNDMLLESWKEIAAYLQRDVGTAMRLTVMANVAAIRLEHQRFAEVEETERALTRELKQAAEIQRGLLPSGPLTIPGVDLAWHSAACHEVGGDYHDFFTYANGRLGMVVADVAGKGMPAALLMCSLQARVQVLAEDSDDLAVLMTRLNRALWASCPRNRFVSLFFCILDPATGEMAYCDGGHNPLLIIRSTGRVERLDGGGPVLGVFPSALYQEQRCRLEPGDMLVLYSDGVTEATSPQEDEFGEERLLKILMGPFSRSAREVVEGVKRALAEWSAGTAPADDITLVVARRSRSVQKPLPVPEVCSRH